MGSLMSIIRLLDASCACRGKKEYTLPYFLKYAAAVTEKASSLSTEGVLPQGTMCLNAPTRSKGQYDATLMFVHYRVACSTIQSMALLTGARGCMGHKCKYGLLAADYMFTPKDVERALWSEAAQQMKPKKVSGTSQHAEPKKTLGTKRKR